MKLTSPTPYLAHSPRSRLALTASLLFITLLVVALTFNSCHEAYPASVVTNQVGSPTIITVTPDPVVVTVTNDVHHWHTNTVIQVVTNTVVVTNCPPTTTVPPTTTTTVQPTGGITLSVTAVGRPHFLVRARGSQIASVTLSTAASNLFIAGSYSLTDKIEVQFDNDGTGIDLFITSISVNGTPLDLSKATHLPSAQWGGWEGSRFALYQNDTMTVNGTLPPTTSTVPATTTTSIGQPSTNAVGLLYFDAASLARARARYAAAPFTPPANPNDGKPAYENALAYLMTGYGSYARAAIYWLNGWSIPPSQASPTANGSDQARWNGEYACLVFSWCKDQMTATERSDFITKFNRDFGNINQQSWGAPPRCQNNYDAGNRRNSYLFGRATLGENAQAQSFITQARVTRYANTFIPFVNDPLRGKGGIPQEGDSYGVVQGEYMVCAWETERILGNDLWTGPTEYWRDMVRWICFATAPDFKGIYTFNESDGTNPGNRTYLGNFMSTVANWNDPTVSGYAAEWCRRVNPTYDPHVSLVANHAAPAALDGLGTFFYAEGMGVVIVRSGWNTGDQVVIFQMKMPVDAAVGHYHMDAGSFQILPLSGESPGYSRSITGDMPGTTVDTSWTEAHNSALIGPRGNIGSLQTRGLATAWWNGRGTVLGVTNGTDIVTASVDLTDCYKSTKDVKFNNTFFTRFVRSYAYQRSTKTTTITDTVTAPATTTYTFLIHSKTATPPFTVRDGTGNVVQPTRTVNEGANGQYRLEYDRTVPGTFTWSIQ